MDIVCYKYYNIVTQAHPPSHSPGGTGQAGSTCLPQSRHLLVLGLVQAPKFVPPARAPGSGRRRPASAPSLPACARDAVRDGTGKGLPSLAPGRITIRYPGPGPLSLCNPLRKYWSSESGAAGGPGASLARRSACPPAPTARPVALKVRD